MIKHIIHHFIAWYLRRCAGAFHVFPYSKQGRYVVLMNDEQYHDYQNPVDNWVNTELKQIEARKEMYAHLDEMIEILEKGWESPPP